MECKDIQALLLAYIENECSDDERKIIETHMHSCVACKNEYEALVALMNGLETIDEVDVPDGFHDDLMNKIKDINNSDKRNQRPLNNKRYLGYMSTVAAAFIVVFIFSIISNMGFFNSMDEDSINEELAFEVEELYEAKELVSEDAIVGAEVYIGKDIEIEEDSEGLLESDYTGEEQVDILFDEAIDNRMELRANGIEDESINSYLIYGILLIIPLIILIYLKHRVKK